MAQICRCNTGPPTIAGVFRSLDRLDNSINSTGTGSGGPGQDPSCECDPCTCPSDTVPCNANALGNDLSNEGLLKKLSSLVNQAREVQAAHGDACDCANRPPYVERITAPDIERPGPERPRREERSPQRLLEPPPSPPPPSPPRPFVPRGLRFFNLPLEVRRRIYGFYFEDLEPLRNIGAVRFRQGEQVYRNRLWRNWQARGRPGRHVIDPTTFGEEDRPFAADEVPIWVREAAAYTYESRADDEELQQIQGSRLGLLLVSRRLREEAGEVFYAQNFHFRIARKFNRIPADQGVYHSILAAEAFLNRREASLQQFRRLEFDLWRVANPERAGSNYEGLAMGLDRPQRVRGSMLNLLWTNGLDRLGGLSNTLRGMSFQHLRLNFRNRAPPWWNERVTDPRVTRNDDYPWTRDLFNIGPRDRLHLDMRITWTHTHPAFEPRYTTDSAAYFMMILRTFLLRNAREVGLQYEGIRVRVWDMGDNMFYARLESDDEWVRGDNPRIVSRLEEPDYDNSMIRKVADLEFMASNDPPPVQEQRTYGPRQRPGDTPQAGGSAGGDGGGEEEERPESPSANSGRQRRKVETPKSSLDK